MEGKRQLEGRIYAGLIYKYYICYCLKSFNLMDFVKDLFNFLRERKKWWLTPIILLLIFIGVLVVIGGGSAVAPFIYTLF